MHEYMDSDGYPTEETLELIRKWDVLKDTEGLLDLIQELWWYSDMGFKRDNDELELHTLGWSGNESLMTALEENFLFWCSYWLKSERGGHYYFCDLDKYEKKQDSSG